MNPRHLRRLEALALACALLAACKSQPAPGDKRAPAASGSPVASASAQARPASSRALQPDPAFMAEFDRVSARCTFVEKRDTVSCPSAELQSLKAKIEALGPAALESLLATVFDAAPARATLASTQLRTAYEHTLGPALEAAAVPERLVVPLLEAMDQLPLSAALRIAPAATFVASREGRLDAVVKITERRPELVTSVAPRVMRYSRMRAFDAVQKWASSPDEATVLAALEALRLMDDWTEEERAQIAPWLQSMLGHKSNKVQGKAAAFLLLCGNDGAARGLGWFEAAMAGKRMTQDAVFAFGRRCHPDHHARLSKEALAELAGTPLCAKIEKALDRLAADEKSERLLRDAALQTLSTIWPKTALRRAQAMTKSDDVRVAQTARNVVKLLSEQQAR